MMNDVIWMNEVDKMPKSDWLIEDVIPSADDGCCLQLVGEEGCGKSFVVLDLACHVAIGKDWLGHATAASGYVLYICGERLSEMPKRVEAWAKEHNHGRIPTTVGIVEQIDLINPKAVDNLIDTVDKVFPQQPLLIIVDTLTSCQTGVDENLARDASIIRDGLKRLQRRYSATVVVVHHLNKNHTSGRGSNVLRGHVDGEYKLSKNGLVIEMKATKMNKSAGCDLSLQAKVVPTSIEPTLVIVGATTTQKATKTGVVFPGAPTKGSWMDAIRAVKGDQEWNKAEGLALAGVPIRTFNRYLNSEAVVRVSHGIYRLS